MVSGAQRSGKLEPSIQHDTKFRGIGVCQGEGLVASIFECVFHLLVRQARGAFLPEHLHCMSFGGGTLENGRERKEPSEGDPCLVVGLQKGQVLCQRAVGKETWLPQIIGVFLQLIFCERVQGDEQGHLLGFQQCLVGQAARRLNQRGDC